MNKKRNKISKMTKITIANTKHKIKIKFQAVKMYSRSQKQAKSLNLPNRMTKEIL